MWQQLLLVLQYGLLVFLTIQVAYLFFFSLMGTLVRVKRNPLAKHLRTIRIFIPGYKEDAVIINTARQALEQDYPQGKFEIVIIADSFSPQTLATLRTLPIQLLEVTFDKSTKGKALQKAIEATQSKPVEIVLILDADNHMAPGFLHAVNDAFEQGYQVVQGHRTAKNLQTSFAFLDACTEEINNHIFRRGHVAVNLPSALIGSGMAFDWPLFVNLLNNIGDTAGEDKELEFRIMRRQLKIAFLDGAYVFDEKVSKTAVFSQQRSRWLAMQVEFAKKYFVEGWVQLLKGNIAFFNKAFQTYLLPRVMLVALVIGWLIFTLLFLPKFAVYSTVLVFALMLSLLMGIPRRWYNRQLLHALLQVPGALASMMMAMMHLKKAGKQFIHTPHGEAELKNT